MRKKRNDGHCLYPFRIRGKDATLDPAEKEGGKRTDVAQRTDYARVRHERATVVAQHRDAANAHARNTHDMHTYTVAGARVLFSTVDEAAAHRGGES